MWWVVYILSLASIPLSGEMARERGRSPRAWFWIAAVIGPLAPFVLFLLGQARRSAPAS